MKRLLLLFFPLVFVSFSLFAQNVGLGVQFGTTKTSIYNVVNGIDDNFEANNGLNMGLNLQVKFGNIGLCTELNYEQHKFSKIGDTYFDGQVWNYPQIMNYLHYHLSLPVLLKYYFGPFNIQTGIQISRFTSGFEQSEVSAPSHYYENAYMHDVGGTLYWRFQEYNYAAVMGFGLDINLKPGPIGSLDFFMSCRTIVNSDPILNMDWINTINTEYNSPYSDSMMDQFSRYVTLNIVAGFRINIL